MSNYLKTLYFRKEKGENDYPQKLCDHLIERYIGPSNYKRRLLDVGSGKGNHLEGFARRGFLVRGLDNKSECVNASCYKVSLCDIERESFPFRDNEFDVVFSKSVLEHVFNADNFLLEVHRVLKIGGIAVMMTPDWNTQHEIFWDDYTHVKAWTRKSLQNAMRIKGFINVESILFRQLPILWKYPWLKVLCDITSLLPHSLKWKDKKEEQFRMWIRFSKEKMILATGVKNDK